MGLTRTQLAIVAKAQSIGGGDLGVNLSDEACNFLLATIARDLDLLRKFPEITAIFALTDACAVGVLRAAFELGLNVPRDLSVIGFDDIPLASHVIPRLTTLQQPTDMIGQTAANLLLRQIEESDTLFQTVTVGTQLVVRESTASPLH